MSAVEEQAAVIAGRLGEAAINGDPAVLADLIDEAMASEPLCRAVIRLQAQAHARAAARVTAAEYAAEHGLAHRYPGARER